MRSETGARGWNGLWHSQRVAGALPPPETGEGQRRTERVNRQIERNTHMDAVQKKKTQTKAKAKQTQNKQTNKNNNKQTKPKKNPNTKIERSET